MPRVLVCDDDPAQLSALSVLLEAAGFEVSTAATGTEALVRWRASRPDLVICDFHMPAGGLDLVKAVSSEAGIPTIVLSADHQESVKVAALDAGADDYITKPFGAGELLARARVALRRTADPAQEIRAGALTLRESDLTARMGGVSVHLTPTEFNLCKTLAVRDGFVATGDLLAAVWGPAYQTELDYVRIYVRRIRQKLEGIGLVDAIENQPGLGYRFTAG
jgi:two-component system KDP operon response regulator KdpE